MKKIKLHGHPGNNRSNSRGSTLIELLIAATVTVMVMTAVAISMMYSIQREAQNRYKETATSLGQDTLDLVQTKRADLGWERFVSTYHGTYCVENNGTFSTAASCTSTTYGGLAFTRSVTLDSSGGGIKATVTVTWQSSNAPSTYTIKQTYYKGVY